jgi:hypothetical protein
VSPASERIARLPVTNSSIGHPSTMLDQDQTFAALFQLVREAFCEVERTLNALSV